MDLLCELWPPSERFVHGLRSPAGTRDTLVATAIIGLTLLADAAAQIALALSVSTTTFVGVTGVTRLSVFSLGLAICARYLRAAARRRRQADATDTIS